jgi:hypothetical protein
MLLVRRLPRQRLLLPWCSCFEFAVAAAKTDAAAQPKQPAPKKNWAGIAGNTAAAATDAAAPAKKPSGRNSPRKPVAGTPCLADFVRAANFGARVRRQC